MTPLRDVIAARSTSGWIGRRVWGGVPPIASPRLRGVHNSEGGHLVSIETSGRESEPGTEINFLGGNKWARPALSASSGQPCRQASQFVRPPFSKSGTVAAGTYQRPESMRPQRFKTVVGPGWRDRRFCCYDPPTLPSLHRAYGPGQEHGSLLRHGNLRNLIRRAMSHATLGPDRRHRAVTDPSFRTRGRSRETLPRPDAAKESTWLPPQVQPEGQLTFLRVDPALLPCWDTQPKWR